jgi:exosome complex component RRP4
LTEQVQNKQLVSPGELLCEGDYLVGENTFRDVDKVYSSQVGVVDFSEKRVSVIRIKGPYLPRPDDLVIGRIIDILMSGWLVDIHAPYPALLPASEVSSQNGRQVSDLSTILRVGDLVISNVLEFDRTRDPLITAKGPGLGRVSTGKTVEISSAKIPRLIGRNGSMVDLLKKETKSHILVGQNGIVLVSSESPEGERAAISAIKMIEREAHTQGLTDRVKALFQKEAK